MPRYLFRSILLLISILASSGCISISRQNQLLSTNGHSENKDSMCLAQSESPLTNHTLNENGFTVVSWNIYKQNKKGWKQDLNTLSDDSDLILLQEAYLTNELTHTLGINEKEWDMISAFQYRDIHTGVMTIGDIPSISSCGQRTSEPIIRFPKSSLINYFPIQNHRKTLLVANIHAVNFTTGMASFNEQLMKVRDVMAQHQGPIVFAGDFNTWSQERMMALNQVATDLGLTEVTFSNSSPVRMLGHHLDHIFFRGLEAVNAEAIEVESSDHFPLKVQFEFSSTESITP